MNVEPSSACPKCDPPATFEISVPGLPRGREEHVVSISARFRGEAGARQLWSAHVSCSLTRTRTSYLTYHSTLGKTARPNWAGSKFPQRPHFLVLLGTKVWTVPNTMAANNNNNNNENQAPQYADPDFNSSLPSMDGMDDDDTNLGKSVQRLALVTNALMTTTTTTSGTSCPVTLEEAGRELQYQHQLVQRATAADTPPAWFAPAIAPLLAPLRSDIADLRADITGMQANITGMQANITGMQANMNVMRAEQIRKSNFDNLYRGSRFRFPVVLIEGGSIPVGSVPTLNDLGLPEDFVCKRKSLDTLDSPQLTNIYQVYREPGLQSRRPNTLASRRHALVVLLYGNI